MSNESVFNRPFDDIDAKNKIDKKLLKYFKIENKTSNPKLFAE